MVVVCRVIYLAGAWQRLGSDCGLRWLLWALRLQVQRHTRPSQSRKVDIHATDVQQTWCGMMWVLVVAPIKAYAKTIMILLTCCKTFEIIQQPTNMVFCLNWSITIELNLIQILLLSGAITCLLFTRQAPVCGIGWSEVPSLLFPDALQHWRFSVKVATRWWWCELMIDWKWNHMKQSHVKQRYIYICI